ncbi:hypothetical protein [Rubritalea profundi]|uniref:Uncharacterized protein n=1 Tax=Rubritalea profundi TaxID=1658618 RepID=A0A2S7U5K0_9BACT|nr:hypothetical protein [Rubritalea profundi]PQJ29721.1 hypothetical protein BSZ32_15315 [Rubritalea profundi]
MKSFTTIALYVGLLVPATAQVLTPPNGASNVTKGGTSNGNNGSGNTTINRHESASPSAQGGEIPIVDPTSKTFQFQGRTYSMTDNNLGGQFEAYLASQDFESKAAVEYHEKIEKIQDFLSPLNPGGPNLKSAYTLLEDASNYPGDGGICDSLANSVYSGRLAMKGIGNKKEAIAKLEKEHRRLVHNLNVLEKKGTLGGTTTVKQGKKTTTSKAAQFTQYKVMQERMAEITDIKKKYVATGVISLTQSKVQYQAMMLQLFIQRRFEHVVMSARFYNIIYKDGDQAMRIKKGSDTEKFFSEGLGVNPTVAGLDAAANEAIRKSQTLISAFQNNIDSNRIHAASERLVEAFLVGEFIPCVQTVSMGMKERVQQYVQDANDLVEALSAKELAQATELNESLKTQARDYNPSKANSYIAAHKRASDGHVRDAKFALFEKDTSRAKVAIENAIKHWPANPTIQTFNDKLDERLDQGEEDSDTLTQTVKEFDRLLADKNYRAIVEEPRKSKFVVVFGQTNDEPRIKQLTEIGESITEIEKALGKSQSLVEAGQSYAAWEAIFETQNKYYDDPKIANAKAQLIGQVGNFTNALTKAKRLEEGGATPQTGSALSWYLKARDIYPQSQFAKEGLERIVSKQFEAAN